MIPKTIHYCWFGGNPKGNQVIECIQSWKKYCPEYKIKEWNESNFPIETTAYTKDAYSAKKWAFVSDFARFKILEEFGGIYMDTDVELIRPIDDIIESGPFMACERDKGHEVINPGLILGAIPHMRAYQDILSIYEHSSFTNSDGTNNYKTVVDFTTQYFEERGFIGAGSIEKISGIEIYPHAFFSPINFKTGLQEITEDTRGIHHYAMSWLSEDFQKWVKLEQFFTRHLGERVAHIVVSFLQFPERVWNACQRYGLSGVIMRLFKGGNKNQ